MAGRGLPAPDSQRACELGVCDGSGWILGPEDVARPCECRERRLDRARTRGLSTVIPQRYSRVSFDAPPVSTMARDMATRHAVSAAQRYLADLDANLEQGRGIWLMGNTGTGKTTLGMLIADRVSRAGRSVAVYFAPKLLTRIRQTYQAANEADSYTRLFERLTSVDLLFIDDLGAERHTDWVIEQLYALINERYEAERAVLVTSNAEADVGEGLSQLQEQIGTRTVSRLVEICGDPLPMFGPDNRIQAQAAAG
jgi:DNA replication protein DnaC